MPKLKNTPFGGGCWLEISGLDWEAAAPHPQPQRLLLRSPRAMWALGQLQRDTARVGHGARTCPAPAASHRSIHRRATGSSFLPGTEAAFDP